MTRNSPNTQTFEEFPKYPDIRGIFWETYSVIWEVSKIFKLYQPQIPIGIWEISQMPGYLGNFPNALVFGKFPKCLGIWKIFPNAWVSGKFPKCLSIWEISQIPWHLRNFQNLKNIPPSNTYRNFREFPKSLGIWEISQIPWHLRNFQNLKNIPPSNTDKNLGNFLNAWVSGKFHKCLGICEISQTPRHLRNFQNL